MNKILLSNFLNRLQLEAFVSDGSLNPWPHPHEESVGYSPQRVRHRYPRQVVHTTQAAHNAGLHNGHNGVVQCKEEHGRQQRHYHQQPGDRAHRSWCHLSAVLAATDLVNLRRRRIGLAFCHGFVFCVVNRAVTRKALKQASYESRGVMLSEVKVENCYRIMHAAGADMGNVTVYALQALRGRISRWLLSRYQTVGTKGMPAGPRGVARSGPGKARRRAMPSHAPASRNKLYRYSLSLSFPQLVVKLYVQAVQISTLK